MKDEDVRKRKRVVRLAGVVEDETDQVLGGRDDFRLVELESATNGALEGSFLLM